MASDFSIRHAAHIVRHGGIIAYPTDTIYGLGCDPYNFEAITRLSDIKQRTPEKQFILLAAHIEQIQALVVLSKEQQETIQQQKEPTSWVIKADKTAPAWLLSDDGTITIRISKHNDVRKLCHALGHAIISTSANLSGQKPARNALELHQRFHSTIDKILASNRKLTARPSKIIRLCDNRILRN
jgi:L-threonylcarbamoyladenylate synthase